MPAKRKPSEDDLSDYVVKEEPDGANDSVETGPPSTPKKANKKARATPSPTTSHSSALSVGGSPKAIFGAMIVEAGIKSLSKSDVQAATGLTSAQQIEMLKKNRGSLRKALMAAVSTL